MKTAFIELKSPRESDPANTISRYATKAESTIILFEDGVYHAVVKHAADKLKAGASEVLVAADDLEGRGFSSADLKVGRAVEYAEIVESIMERTERTITL